MAIIWMDGFDHYNATVANLQQSYTLSNTSNFSLDSSNPHTGSYALTATASRTADIGIGGSRQILGVGGWFYVSVLPGTQQQLVDIREADGGVCCRIYLMSSGALRAVASTSPGVSQIGSDSSETVLPAGYFHLEVKVTLSGGDVIAVVNLNGDEVINGSVTSARTELANVLLHFANSPQIYVDDFFIWDTSGSVNNDFIGPKRVLTLFPSADTASADWTGDYTDIATNDGDTSYISASDSTPITSEFELDNLPSGVSGVVGVQTIFVAKTDDAGAANVQASLISGSATDDGTDHPMTSSYGVYSDISEVDPNTSTAWTVSSVNAAKLRLRRTS